MAANLQQGSLGKHLCLWHQCCRLELERSVLAASSCSPSCSSARDTTAAANSLAPQFRIGPLPLSFAIHQDRSDPPLPDSRKAKAVWEKSNKDESRDKRHSENRQLPVMEYGEVTFRSGSGIYEKYMFSDAKKAEELAALLKKFRDLI